MGGGAEVGKLLVLLPKDISNVTMGHLTFSGEFQFLDKDGGYMLPRLLVEQSRQSLCLTQPCSALYGSYLE